MDRLRQTLSRMRGRRNSDPDATSAHTKKKRRFPRMKFRKFLKRFKHDKQQAKADSEKADTEVSIPITGAKSEDNILLRPRSDANFGGETDTDDKQQVNGINGHGNHITINVECHDQDHEDDEVILKQEGNATEDDIRAFGEPCLGRLTPDRLSRASFGTGPLSRSSMISQKSMSIISMASFRKPETRTIWTQTETPDNEMTTMTTQTSSGNLLSVATTEETSKGISDTVSEFDVPWDSTEFGIDGIMMRPPVENPVLAAHRDRIVHRLTYPNIDMSEPEVCVDLLRYAKLPYLIVLNRKISIEGGRFNEEFIELRGLDFLLILMEEIASAGLESLFDVTKMMLVSECATSLVNSPSGRDYIISHGEHVVSLARDR